MQNKLDAEAKAIQQIGFVWKMKNDSGINADGTQSIFVLKILEKIRKTSENSQLSVKVI